VSKLLEHFKRMQEMATRYITPEPYETGVPEHGQLVGRCQGEAKDWLFASDMIYMLDGPEQREAQAEADVYDDALAAMREFCARVDRGEVRSKRTYAKFAAILERVAQR
jgi:hypothetical protein